MEITADWTDRAQRERRQRSTLLVPLSFSFSFSAQFDWYLLMPAAAHPYFMSISDRIQRALKMIAGHWNPFHRRIKRSLVIWALDCKAGPWKVTVKSAKAYSAATCVSRRIDLAPCDSDYRISSSVWNSMTKWLQICCNWPKPFLL